MPLLDETAVSAAIASLDGWTGDAGRIARTIQVSGADAEQLQVDVMGVADRIDHHPLVEQHGDALTFILWTHSAGGVTDKDIELARRIDEIVQRPAAPDA
jgi:4a-hydroxytetrahydrobiopterin dehydratase